MAAEEGLSVEEAFAEIVGEGASEAAEGTAFEPEAAACAPEEARPQASEHARNAATRTDAPGEGSQAPARFPLFVDLAGKRCLVVGGGKVGRRRARVLSEFGADVLVLDPAHDPGIEGVRYEPRGFTPGDEAGCALAVAATGDRAVNEAVGRACRAAGVPVNVADRHEECDFFFPAVCRSAHLTAGLVSDSGSHHALVAQAARALRETLKEVDA